MSANLVDGKSPILSNGATYTDGVYTIQANEQPHSRSVIDIIIQDANVLTDNQTCHFGYSVKVASGDSYSGYPAVQYEDAAGNVNYVGKTVTATGTGDWQRVETSFVVPSGMRINDCFLIQNGNQPTTYVTGIVLSYGTSGPILASDSHTPYATQDHVAAEYATRAQLKVDEDKITSEVSERTKLDGRVGTLESTSSEHTSKITQLSSSIESMVKGEATYTAPDGTTKTNGLYSKITQTANGINETFGQYTKTADMQSQISAAQAAATSAANANTANSLKNYTSTTAMNQAISNAQTNATNAANANTTEALKSYTTTSGMNQAISAAQSAATSAANSATDSKLSGYTKTADLASTAAVKDAKKAGTDAASAASAAQNTANTAKANAATAQTTANTAVTNASTAQSTADAAKTAAANAQSTADAAKGTADGLATLIRKDSTGVTVGYTTDGTTFTQGRTHMGQDSFDVLDSNGNTLETTNKNGVGIKSSSGREYFVGDLGEEKGVPYNGGIWSNSQLGFVSQDGTIFRDTSDESNNLVNAAIDKNGLFSTGLAVSDDTGLKISRIKKIFADTSIVKSLGSDFDLFSGDNCKSRFGELIMPDNHASWVLLASPGQGSYDHHITLSPTSDGGVHGYITPSVKGNIRVQWIFIKF